MTKKVLGGWVFRVEVVSDKIVMTEDAKSELAHLLYSSKVFGNWKVDELFESVGIMESKPKKKVGA